MVSSPVSISIAFVRTTYSVTFVEGGLAPGTTWAITLNGTQRSSGSNITFVGLTNGTYTFQVPSVDGYSAHPLSGSVTIDGFNQTSPVIFISTALVHQARTLLGLSPLVATLVLIGIAAVSPARAWLWCYSCGEVETDRRHPPIHRRRARSSRWSLRLRAVDAV